MEKNIYNIKMKILVSCVVIILLIEYFIPLKGIAATPGFSQNITFNVTYEPASDVMPYALISPSSANKKVKMPLIIWLHGRGERGISSSAFLNQGLPSLFQSWNMKGFNAYILCPQLSGDYYSGGFFCNDTGKANVKNLIDKFSSEYAVDRKNISLVGFSDGAMGALYIAGNMPNYFSNLVVMSGALPSGVSLSQITMPVRGFTGSSDHCRGFMVGDFARAFGSDKVVDFSGCGHTGVYVNAFKQDGNGDGCSDLVEWLFDNTQGTYPGGYSGDGSFSDGSFSDGSFSDDSYGGDNFVFEDIESEMTGLDTVTGIILEPTVKFFTFIIDSIMSVFSGIMTQNDFEFVMVDREDISKIEDLGEAGATYTIADMEPYKTASGSLDKLKYPNFTYSPEEIFAGKLDLLDINFIDDSNDDESWNKIRSVISQWYQILRMIAIIGLLSVLIYTGIKIIISSNTKDKAKYKEIITNWFIAVILAFSMHYIMAFILSVIEEILGLLKGITGVIGVTAGDVTFKTNQIGLARFQMQQQHFSAKVGHLVIYTALVTYTFKFTFLYFKRVLKMAFLTIISPIVALTYPIDKANEGKAQGFQMWLKEFIYNALLQPMHYILYYILVTSSLTLAARNPVYGIVALMFISQAEKLLKKIFGFDKARAGTVGGIAGAFATGAITSSLMNYVRDPLHPFGGGNGTSKSNVGQRKLGSEDNLGEVPNDVNEDYDVYDFLDKNISRSSSETTYNPEILGISDFLYRYRQDLPRSIKELGGLSFNDGDFRSIDQLLQTITDYERMLKNPNLSSERRQQLNDELIAMKNILQNRVMSNEFNFTSNGIPFQYTDGDSRSTSDLMNEVMRLREIANKSSLSPKERQKHSARAQSLLKTVKSRMAQNQYMERQGGLQALLEQEGMLRPTSNEEEGTGERTRERTEEESEKQNSTWKKLKNAPVTKGLTNVGKTIVKPVWDTEKGVKYNGERLAKNILKGAAGATVGVAAAAVQAGISITDGKYKPLEGVATVGAGIAGVSNLTKKAESVIEANREDEKSIKQYGEQWYNSDNVIDFYNKEFPGQGKEMRRRAVNNYVSRGITDVKDQKQAMKFANKLMEERGMDIEEADKLAIATLQYKKSLVGNNTYNILFDTKKKEKYLDIQADAYSGSASKDSVKKLHNDFIENVREFDIVNS